MKPAGGGSDGDNPPPMTELKKLMEERTKLAERESNGAGDRELSRRIDELNEKILRLKKSMSY